MMPMVPMIALIAMMVLHMNVQLCLFWMMSSEAKIANKLEQN